MICKPREAFRDDFSGWSSLTVGPTKKCAHLGRKRTARVFAESAMGLHADFTGGEKNLAARGGVAATVTA
jgi:hypothetical protein